MSLLNKPDVDTINHRGGNMKAWARLCEFLFCDVKYSVNPENVTILSLESHAYVRATAVR